MMGAALARAAATGGWAGGGAGAAGAVVALAGYLLGGGGGNWSGCHPFDVVCSQALHRGIRQSAHVLSSDFSRVSF